MKFEKKNDELIRYWKKGDQFEGYLIHHYSTEIIFDKFFKDIRNKKILEIGCGHGHMVDLFNKKGAIAEGVDISPEAVSYSKSKGVNAIEGDCRNLPFKDNSFDIVFSLGVVEHFNETSKAIKEHFRVCKPNGKVVIIVPNFTLLHLCAILAHLKWVLKYNIMITTGKSYTKNQFKRILRDCGSSNTNILVYGGSAFLKFAPLNKRLISFVENSWFSRNFGLFLFSISNKIVKKYNGRNINNGEDVVEISNKLVKN